MGRATVEVATDEHARALAGVMRAADEREVYASSGCSPFEALKDSMLFSDAAWAILFGRDVGGIFGVAELDLFPPRTYLAPSDTGVAWMLTGESVDRNKAAFLRVCREWIPHLLERYPRLINFVDVRHRQSLRWAQWLGFQIHPPVPFGVQGLPFHPIELVRA